MSCEAVHPNRLMGRSANYPKLTFAMSSFWPIRTRLRLPKSKTEIDPLMTVSTADTHGS